MRRNPGLAICRRQKSWTSFFKICACQPWLGLWLATAAAWAAGDYRSVVLSDSPVAYWRFGEAGGSTAEDSAGLHPGTLTAITTGRPGAITNDADTAFGFNAASSVVRVPYSAELNPSAYSFEVWAKLRQSGGYGRVITAMGNSRGYNLNVNGVLLTWDYFVMGAGWLDSRRALTNQWTHVVGTFDGTNQCLYVDGLLCHAKPRGLFAPNPSEPLYIGAEAPGSSTFPGDLDEAAIYGYALPEERVRLHFGWGRYGANISPVILQEPTSQSIVAGSTAGLSLFAYGDPAPSYQWYKNGSPIPGATSSSLVLSNSLYSDTGLYWASIENIFGVTNSHPVNLSVVPSPRFCLLTNSLVLHLKFDGDFLDCSGRGNNGTGVRGPQFVAGQIGSGALHYRTDVSAGVSNYVTLGTPSDLQFGSNIHFSVSYWVRFTGLPGDLPFLCNSINSINCPGFAFAPSYNLGGWSWSLCPTGSGGELHLPVYGPNSSINDGAWHHLLHTFDRDGYGITYLDGAFADATGVAARPNLSLSMSGPVNIGQDATGRYPESGQADIDDLGVWRRVLSPQEALWVYLAGKNHGETFDTYGPVELLIQNTPAGVELIWPAGELETADDVVGPWEAVAGATAPLCRISTDQVRRFYRVKL